MCISSRLTLGDVMTDEVTGPHSKMEAEGAWNNDNPEDKISRSVPVWYDLDKYVIRRVDGKVVGIAGYSDKGTYAILGGMKSKEGSRSWRPMSEKRLELIGDKPKIAGFKAKTIPNETWKEKNRQVYNFDIPPEDEMGIDSKLIEQFRDRYGDDFGIKKWQMVLKRRFTSLNEMEDWLRIFIETLYEMQRMLDTPTGPNHWVEITNLISYIAYEEDNNDITKFLKEIINIIKNKYGEQGRIILETLETRIKFKTQQLNR